MNRTTVILAFCTLALGLLLGWIFFGGNGESPEGEHNNSAIAGSEVIWTCSMHPQIRQTESGDCPICGMDLIPLESADNNLDPAVVKMSATAMQLAQVQTIAVGNSDAKKSIRLTGKVQIDERLLYTQPSHIPGRVEKLTVNFTGDYVVEGQVIAYVYSPELVTAQEELFAAQKFKESQPALFEAAKGKLRNWKLSENQVSEILASNKVLEQYPIRANVSGYVTKKMVNLGDYLKQGEALYEIADLSQVWVLFDVHESDIEWVKKGNPVNYTVASLPGRLFDGTVSFIDPVIDPKTRVAKARVETNNKDLLLKPEMFVNGTLEAELAIKNKALIVPKPAVLWTGKRSVVYVMKSSDNGVYFQMREVTLGQDLGESFIIESGLEVGEEIAVNGVFSIDAAAQLAGKPSMMNPTEGEFMSGHNHGAMTTPMQEDATQKSKAIELSKEAENELDPIFDAYFELKNALVADDLKLAFDKSQKLLLAIEEVDETVFSPQNIEEWRPYSEAMLKILSGLKKKDDLANIRAIFMSVSHEIILFVKAIGGINELIYVDYCPMANDNKGAEWISKEKEIQNPYFGESMLRCGDIVQEIK